MNIVVLERTIYPTDKNSPDIVLLKHHRVTYPLHCKPYTINDSTSSLARYGIAEKIGMLDP